MSVDTFYIICILELNYVTEILSTTIINSNAVISNRIYHFLFYTNMSE